MFSGNLKDSRRAPLAGMTDNRILYTDTKGLRGAADADKNGRITTGEEDCSRNKYAG